jgi:hypothetical protein
MAIIGYRLTPLAVDLPDRRRLSAKPFWRIIDRAEWQFTPAFAKLGEGNAGPGGLILLADDVGYVAHSVFVFLSRTPGHHAARIFHSLRSRKARG